MLAHMPMIYDSLIMAAVAAELTQTIAGGKVQRITQPTPLDVIVQVYAGSNKYDLLLSCEAESARVHLTHIKRDNPPQPYAFCMLLRKYIDGAQIIQIDRPGGFAERILAVRFRAHDGTSLSLIAEIMGKHSNIMLLDGDNVILGAAKQITSDVNRYREVLPGLDYRLPPRQRGKRDPIATHEPAQSVPIEPGDIASTLIAQYAGVSPVLAKEAAIRIVDQFGPTRTGVMPVKAAEGLRFTPQDLWSGLNDLLDVIKTGAYTPLVWTDDARRIQGAYPIRLLSEPETNQHPRDSISQALDDASTAMGTRDAFEAARDSLATALARARRRREKDLDDVEQGLTNAARADEYQQNGDLIMASQDSLERGSPVITIPDYYAPAVDGEAPTRVIAVDPALSWRQNAERYYKKAAKARNSRVNLQARRLDLLEEVRLLERAELDLAAATTVEQAMDIHERTANLLSRGSGPDTGKGGPGRGRQKAAGDTEATTPGPRFPGYKIRSYHSLDGWEILIGENATSNDYLTTKIAASSDIWMHVRAATSAHGVIRARSRPGAVSQAALLHAAEIVAAHSEVKHSSLIPVDYTLKKYVRKPRRSAPGSVTYQNEKTLYVAGINDRD
jgi:predicted ribosome quality control (RQC) complex YloA/Tae2 family protein